MEILFVTQVSSLIMIIVGIQRASTQAFPANNKTQIAAKETAGTLARGDVTGKDKPTRVRTRDSTTCAQMALWFQLWKSSVPTSSLFIPEYFYSS